MLRQESAPAGYRPGSSTGAVTFNSMLQATVPDRGRVMATFDITWQAGRLASLGIGGVLADHLGITARRSEIHRLRREPAVRWR